MLDKTSNACEALECIQQLVTLEEMPCSYMDENISPNIPKTAFSEQ